MTDKEREITEARIRDALKQCEQRSVPKFVGFLDASGAAAAVSVSKGSTVRTVLYGGYDSAERVCFGAFPDWSEIDLTQFPITRLRVINRSDRRLSHRDILGALMSAGIERDTVGDIITSGEYPIIFVRSSVAEHIKAHIDRIASAGVSIVEDTSDEICVIRETESKSGTVASMRLDCVVAELADCSRAKALELINGRAVALCGIEAQKCTAEVGQGDTVTVRHVGKFVIDQCDRVTKKGRIALIYRKYI